MELKQKVNKGLRYVLFFNIFGKGLTFLTTIILARILFPEDFGMIALAFMVIGAVGLLKNLGFAEAIIQSKEKLNKIYNTSFLLVIFLSLVLIGLSISLAHPIAEFYGKPALARLIMFLSIIFLLDAIGLVPSTILEKRMEFSKKLIPETVPVIFYAAISIFLAKQGFGFWSLAIGQLISSALQNASFWIINPWRPNFKFDWKTAKFLMSFGHNIFFFSVFVFLLTQGDKAFIGKILSVKELGFYTLAFSLTSLPATNFVSIIGRVTLPTYSRIQKNKELLKIAYLKVLRYTYLLALPATVGLIILSKEITLTIYGTKWIPIIWPIVVLAIFGLFRSISSASGNLFIAVGKPQILKNVSLIQLTVMALLIYPLSKSYGILGTSLAVTIAHFVSIFIILVKTSNIVKVPFIELLKTGRVAFLASIGMAIAVFLLKGFIFEQTLLSNTLILVISGGIAYLLIASLLEKNFIRNMIQDLK